MLRFVGYLALTLACCALVGYGIYAVSLVHGPSKVGEFDFAGYAFGLVAVAVSFSGVYVSIVPESCIAQFKARISAHLIPAPFSDWKNVSDQCHPDEVFRTAQIKQLYVLSIWGSIGRERRRELLEADGLDQSESWFNKRLDWFERQSDRLLAVTLGAAISLLYLAVPITYPFLPVPAAFALLATIYVLCVADVITCALLFWFRQAFVADFDDKAKHWRPTCEAYLAGKVRPPAIA